VKKISIIGAGSFGTAIAVVLGHSGYSISIWAREKEVVDGINQDGYNPEYISKIS
jgi:glycerol-3-phosphate dehydrogenase (NAD(P)+)